MMDWIRRIKRRYLFLAIVLISVCVVMTFLAAKWFREQARQMSYFSAVSWLNTAIQDLSNEYHRENGTYPESLENLNIPFPGDNASPDMLSLFTYETDGNSCKIIWETNLDIVMEGEKKRHDAILETDHVKGYRYETICIKGKTVRFNKYAGDKLISSLDYP